MSYETPDKRDLFDSGLFKDRTGHTIEDYPGEIENEYLLGIDDYGGWYYNPIHEKVVNYQLEGGNGDEPLELKVGFSMEKEEAEDEYDDISELALELVDKTVFGHSMVLSSKLTEHTHLSRPQAKVHALRNVYGVGRTQTARVLDKSPNTIDNQRRSAKRKADNAKRFVNIINEFSPNHD
jgi:DNA-binding transcriptional regulator YiaG